MVKLIVVKNLFDPMDGREVRNLDYDNDTALTVQQVLDEYGFEDVEMQATVNTDLVKDNSEVIKDGDMVVIYPAIAGGGGGGKNIGMLVAAIALSVVAFGVGSGVAGTGWFASAANGLATATGWAAVAGYMAAAAVMFLGSSLIARFTGGNIDVGNFGSYENDPTYTWGDVKSMEGQNNPIGLTYGKVKSGGQTIGKYVSTVDNKEYLNWLLAAGEGELEFSDIKVNDNPVEYYTGMTVETRPGSNHQETISNFNDTYFTKTLGYQMTTTPRIDTVQGNATEGIIVKVEWSSGLYYAKDDGSLGKAWVKLFAGYRLKGATDWIPLISDSAKITKNYCNAKLNTNSCENGVYKVRVSRSVTDDGTVTGASASVTAPSGTKTSATSTTDTISCGPFTWAVADLYAKNSIWFGFGPMASITVDGNNSMVTASQSSALRKEWRVDNLVPGEYEVEAYVVSRSHEETNSRASTKCYWTGLTSIIYDDLCYPGTALVGIKALATDQISGNPTISWLQERSKILAYNPHTGAYEAKDATNPAWAAYDFVHLAKMLENRSTGAYELEVRGAPAYMMMYDRFKAWADFCDEKNLHINVIITSLGEMRTQVNTEIAPVGRGYVIPFGTKIGPIWDAAAEPVQMFGMGNIIKGSFTEEFLPTTDRANAIEITFTNADADYTRDTVTVFGDSYDDADALEKTTQVTYNGITSREQAYREGKYLLYCNQYLLRTVTFSASVDAISATIGDVILVSHDVPNWAYSGRIYEINGTQLKLPVQLDTITGTYRIVYRTVNDVLYTKNCTVLSSADGWTLVNVPDGFKADDPPQKNDVFDLGIIEKGSKPFKIKQISRAQDYTRKITAIEYNENIYNENYNIPDINYSTLEDKIPQNVIQLSARQAAWKDSSGTARCRMYASWALPSGAPACKFAVLISTDGTNYRMVKSGYSQYDIEIDTTIGDQYWLKVISTLNGRASTGTVAGPISSALDTKPPDVTALHHELMADGTRRFWWDYTYPSPNDVAGFRLKYTPNGAMGWADALPLHEGLVVSQPFETGMLRQGMATVLIKAVDNAGNESTNAVKLQINLGDVLVENVLYSKNLALNSWADVTHDGFVDTDGSLKAEETAAMWSSPDSPMWSAPDNPMWITQYKAFTATSTFTAIASGQFWLDLTVAGPLKVTYSVNSGSDFPYSQKVMVKAGDVIKVTMTAFGGTTQVAISKAVLYIDVPDVVEHFNDIAVAVTGTTLPVKCPDYYTTAVRIDAVENNAIVWPTIVSRNPCVIKLYDSTGTFVAGTVDVTWQGFRKELNS